MSFDEPGLEVDEDVSNFYDGGTGSVTDPGFTGPDYDIIWLASGVAHARIEDSPDGSLIRAVVNPGSIAMGFTTSPGTTGPGFTGPLRFHYYNRARRGNVTVVDAAGKTLATGIVPDGLAGAVRGSFEIDWSSSPSCSATPCLAAGVLIVTNDEFGSSENGLFIDDVTIGLCGNSALEGDAAEGCDDGNLLNCDACSPGCQLAEFPCDDGDICTDDICDPVTTPCTFVNNTASCSDGFVCDGDEVCTGGVCANAPDLDCDDLDPCTADTCDEPGGCGHVETLPPACCGDSTECEDFDACTANLCTAAGGVCQFPRLAGCCNIAADCDDGDVCTADTCTGPGGTCSHDAISGCCHADADCTDASACTDDQCNTSIHECDHPAIPGCCNGAGDCDDGDACTTDACGAAKTCSNTDIAGCCNGDGDCNDGDDCTTDTCSAAGGTCSHPGIEGCCNDDGDCNDGVACSDDNCVVASAVCMHTLPDGCCFDAADCNDGDDCTADACDDNACAHAITCDASPTVDASTITGAGDAGTGRDAPARDAGNEQGGGGCACRLGSRGHAPPALALGIVAAAALLLARRRRAR